MSQKYEKLKTLLKELFQLDQPDLDFGLYRVMHAKSVEVTQFLDEALLPQVKEAFGLYKTADKAEIEKDLAKAIEQALGLGVDPESTQKVKDLRAHLKSDAVDIDALESEVYDHLFSFFRRYYSEGDYLAKRVYKAGVYAIPYEGEEVKLHWANADQYYIKTSEYLRDYAFRLRPNDEKNPMRVHFRLVDSSEGEHGNVKSAEGKGRVFVLAVEGESGHDFLTEEEGEQGKELVIQFEYRPATLLDWPESERDGKKKLPVQKDLLVLAAKRLLSVDDSSLAAWIVELGKPHLLSSGEQAEYTRLEAHLRRYTARNTFDYFIHKDLGGFLRRELDFYIKNEVMHLDDVETETAPRVEQYLSKIKVIRKIAGKIIEFLAQLEDFQKKLWLKKKFVVETSWCLSMSCIPEEFYTEIAANEAQRQEWVTIFAIDDIKDDLTMPGCSNPLKHEFLTAHPTLVVDTRHFDADFVARLLEAVSYNEPLAGCVLMQSENYQALSMMSRRYGKQIQCTYIDPPYNTGDDEFPYKDSYQHSSWLAMMADRLRSHSKMLDELGAIVISIGREELFKLQLLCDEVLGVENRIGDLVWEKGRKNDAKLFSLGHDYFLIYASSSASLARAGVVWREEKPGAREILTEYRRLRVQFGEDHAAVESGIRKFYSSLPAGHASLKHRRFNHVDANGIWRDHDISWPGGGGPEYDITHPDTGSPCKVPQGGWRFADDVKFWLYHEHGFIQFRDDHTEPPILKRYLNHVRTDFDPEVSRRSAISSSEDGESVNVQVLPSVIYKSAQPTVRELRHLLPTGKFPNPKDPQVIGRLLRYIGGENAILLDFFAGSGTTGHAVINLNREDGGQRKFILVEMGDYFDTVLIPRLKKVTFSPEWKNGKPKRLATLEEAERSPRIIKVVRLESYEDALNNLATRRTEEQQMLLEGAAAHGSEGLKEQYVLRYMLDVETRGSQSLLNVQAFSDPTAYKLKVKRPGSDESREVNVDLLETFNWLIGLTVRHIAAPLAFTAAFERDREKRLRLKGHLKQVDDGPYWFRTVSGTTPDGRKTLVIWRKLTGEPELDNLVLDEWFTKQGYSAKDSEFDLIYVNGGNNLENLKAPDDTWKVRLIEEDFHRLMFEGEGG